MGRERTKGNAVPQTSIDVSQASSVPLTENRNLERNSLLLAYAYPLHPHAR